MNIWDCVSTDRPLLLSKQLNQSENVVNSPDNAFHRLRLDSNNKISAKGSKCYTYGLTFDRKIQYWFLKIELWTYGDTVKPELTINTNKYRTCKLRRNTIKFGHSVQNKPLNHFTYYFICDLNVDSDYVKERNELSNGIKFDIKTDFTGQLGLETVFIGEIFTDSKNRPECGTIQFENTGVNMAHNDFGYFNIKCNNSFTDLNPANVTDFGLPEGPV